MRAGCREGGSPTWPLPAPRSSARALSRGLAGSGSGICGGSSCPRPPPRQDSRACRTGRRWAPATVGIVETQSSCSEREGVSPSSGGARGAKEKCGGCSRRGAALRLPRLPSKVLTRSSFARCLTDPAPALGRCPTGPTEALRHPFPPSSLPSFSWLFFLFPSSMFSLGSFFCSWRRWRVLLPQSSLA